MGAGRGGTRRARASAAIKPAPEGPTINADGDKEWRNAADELHRVGGPAIERASNHQGLLALRNGDKEWYVNGKRHRVDGPAIECTDGAREWWVDGKWHRVDGPALEYANGDKEWRLNGKLHRLDGPAVEDVDRDKMWYVDDVQLTETEFDELTSHLRHEEARAATWAAAAKEIATNPDYHNPFGGRR